MDEQADAPAEVAAMNASDFPLFRYRGETTRVIDGDTVEVNLHLGFHVTRTIRVRIAGINCPEVYGSTRPAGLEATRATEELLGGGGCYVATHQDRRSFDRWIADLWIAEPDGDLVSIADCLVRAGHAVRVST